MYGSTTVLALFLSATAYVSAVPVDAAAAPVPFTGFYHPAHLPDGNYHVTLDADGNQVHTALNISISERSVTELSNKLAERDCANSLPGTVTCGNNNIDPLAWASLTSQFETLCANSPSIGKHAAIYSQYQDTQMYLCNYAGTINQACSVAEMHNAFSDISCHCPNYQVGYEWISSYYKTYGYQSGKGFCSNNH